MSKDNGQLKIRKCGMTNNHEHFYSHSCPAKDEGKGIDEWLFDFHIRGCDLVDQSTHKACDDYKAQFKQAIIELVRSCKPHPTELQKTLHPNGIELNLVDQYETALLKKMGVTEDGTRN